MCTSWTLVHQRGRKCTSSVPMHQLGRKCISLTQVHRLGASALLPKISEEAQRATSETMPLRAVFLGLWGPPFG